MFGVEADLIAKADYLSTLINLISLWSFMVLLESLILAQAMIVELFQSQFLNHIVIFEPLMHRTLSHLSLFRLSGHRCSKST